MRRAALAAILSLIASAAIVERASSQGTPAAAASVQAKIDRIKKANTDTKRTASERLEVVEAELEAHVMSTLKKDIPVQLDSIRVHLTPGTIGADARLVFPPGATGNFIVDAIISGKHNFVIKGKLSGTKAIGKFDLQDVYVDGIPVPNFLVDVLVKKYVIPKYPDADLKAPFELPWGIDAVVIAQSRATITY